MPSKKNSAPDPVTTLGAIAELAEMPDLIRKVVDGFTKAQQAGLSQRLLILMISDVTRLSKTDVKKVLDALPLLADRFLDAPE